MTQKPRSPTGSEWACFRFSVVGRLLSDPPRAERSRRPSGASRRGRGIIP